MARLRFKIVPPNLTPCFLAFTANIIEPINEITDSRKKERTAVAEPLWEKPLPNDRRPNKREAITDNTDRKTYNPPPGSLFSLSTFFSDLIGNNFGLTTIASIPFLQLTHLHELKSKPIF